MHQEGAEMHDLAGETAMPQSTSDDLMQMLEEEEDRTRQDDADLHNPHGDTKTATLQTPHHPSSFPSPRRPLHTQRPCLRLHRDLLDHRQRIHAPVTTNNEGTDYLEFRWTPETW
jgi:hypothetical protein